MTTQHNDSDAAIAEYTAAIAQPNASVEQVVGALCNRGQLKGQSSDFDGAIADYTIAINLPNAPAAWIAWALCARGSTKRHQGDRDGAIADYTATIGLPNAPAKEVAWALYERGSTKGNSGDNDGAIADYTSTIELPNAPAEHVALALVNRGLIRHQLGEIAGAVADYTAVIALPGAPAKEVAWALCTRGSIKRDQGNCAGAIADYTVTIGLPNVPAHLVAWALCERGSTKGNSGDDDGAISDLTATIVLPNAPAERVGIALFNRGVIREQRGEIEHAVADYYAAIALQNAPANVIEAARSRLVKQNVDKNSASQGVYKDSASQKIDKGSAGSSPFRPTRMDHVAIGFLGMVIYFAIRQTRAWHNEQLQTLLALCVAGIVCLVVGFRFFRRQAQIRINDCAAEALSSSNTIVLYLRPFMTGGRLYVRNALRATDRLLMGLYWDAELALSLALEGKARLIAIGGGNESLGAAKLKVDDTVWVEMMQKCAERAFAIIVVPLSRPSTMWEVSYLFQNPDLLAKTLFFMPPTNHGIGQWLTWLSNGSPSNSWAKARDDCEIRGIHLPPYQQKGCWFRMGTSGKVSITIPLLDMDPECTFRIVSAIFPGTSGGDSQSAGVRHVNFAPHRIDHRLAEIGAVMQAEDAEREERKRENKPLAILQIAMMCAAIGFLIWLWWTN